MEKTRIKYELADTFLKALNDKDWELMRTIMAPNITWVLPGDNQISGEVSGDDAVIDRARLIASYGLDFELLHVLVSRGNMALSLHNTAQKGELVLDEYLSTVCKIEDERIAGIETYLSDVEGMNAFFAELP